MLHCFGYYQHSLATPLECQKCCGLCQSHTKFLNYWGGSAPPCKILGGLEPLQPPFLRYWVYVITFLKCKVKSLNYFQLYSTSTLCRILNYKCPSLISACFFPSTCAYSRFYSIAFPLVFLVLSSCLVLDLKLRLLFQYNVPSSLFSKIKIQLCH